MSQLLQSSRENEFSPFLPFSSMQSLSGLGVTTRIGKANLASADSHATVQKHPHRQTQK